MLLRTESPVRVTEVQTNLPALPEPYKAVEPPKAEEKLTPDLRAVLGGADPATPLRLEVILALTPDESDRVWRRELYAAAPGLVIEGRVGPLVSVKVPPAQVRARPTGRAVW